MSEGTNAQKDGLYQKLPVMCDLSQVALEECAIRMAPRREYKLYVGRMSWPFACMLLRMMGATVQNNPFAPYINLVRNDNLERREWFLEGDAGEAWGSEGV